MLRGYQWVLVTCWASTNSHWYPRSLSFWQVFFINFRKVSLFISRIFFPNPIQWNWRWFLAIFKEILVLTCGWNLKQWYLLGPQKWPMVDWSLSRTLQMVHLIGFRRQSMDWYKWFFQHWDQKPPRRICSLVFWLHFRFNLCNHCLRKHCRTYAYTCLPHLQHCCRRLGVPLCCPLGLETRNWLVDNQWLSWFCWFRSRSYPWRQHCIGCLLLGWTKDGTVGQTWSATNHAWSFSTFAKSGWVYFASWISGL